MVAEVIGEVLGGALRVVGRFFWEMVVQVLFELLIQGVGYLLCQPFKPDVEPDGTLATVVGLVAWVLFIAGGYLASQALA